MKYNFQIVLSIFLVFFIVGCSATQPISMSKDSIRQLKNIVVIIEPEDKRPAIIDPTGIRGQAYNDAFSGGAAMYGLLGVLVASTVAEVKGHYDVKEAMGENSEAAESIKAKQEYLEIIYDGISESFGEKISKRDYINFENIVFLNRHNGEELNVYGIYDPDHVVSIKYLYGIGVRKSFPPQPAISASLIIFSPKTDQFIEKRVISSDSYSFNKSQGKIPTIEEYAKNDAQLFKHDIEVVAKILGGEIARLYTYY